MKIFTLTCHDVYNYGASLQAFALQKYLILQGHNVSIIDYKPDYLNSKYRLSWYVNPNSTFYNKSRNNFVIRTLYVLKRYLTDLKTLDRKKKFDYFTEKYLFKTKRYENYIQLCQDPPVGNVYIVGSDQVWNNDPLINGWDASFFLQFGHKKIRRIAYAASLGSAKSCSDIMSYWINSLDAISVRERSSLELMKEITKPIKVVCDPVFLLDKKEWIDTIELVENKNDYILVYNLSGNNKLMMEHANHLSKKFGLKIHYLVIGKTISGVQNIKGAGPKEFLEEILNARYILSDSFHATAFSLIFNKDFITYSFGSERASQRMIFLLDLLGLQHLYNPRNIDMNLTYDHNMVLQKLSTYIQESKNWLSEQI